MQQHDLIRSLAEEASSHWSIPFQYEDFRVGWTEGQNEARSLGIYRQAYCGCIYSERDRFERVRTARSKTAQDQSRPPKRSAQRTQGRSPRSA
jgi:hypothetical protein